MTLRLNMLPLGLAAGLAFAPMMASAQRDGTPGNPPGTATGRAVDGMTGNRTAPDGTPGNPPGTALGRAVDGATGNRTAPDGTPGNPPGTAVGRALDGTTGNRPAPDGTPGNPPGTAVGRALDGTTGNRSAPDGTPGNPPGTAIGRALDGTPANPPGTVMDRAAGQAAPGVMPPAAMTAGSAVMMRPRLSQLIGGNVYNERNERVGEVDDIILAPPSALASPGSGPLAIIQVGGFLGMGGRLVTLPLGDLRWNAEREHLVMPGATRDGLGARPAFEYGMLRTR